MLLLIVVILNQLHHQYQQLQNAFDDERRISSDLRRSNTTLEKTLESVQEEKDRLQHEMDQQQIKMQQTKELEMRIKILEEENYSLLTNLKNTKKRMPMQPMTEENENVRPPMRTDPVKVRSTEALHDTHAEEKPGNCEQQ